MTASSSNINMVSQPTPENAAGSQSPKPFMPSTAILNSTDNKSPYILFEYPTPLKPYRTSFNSIFASLIAVSTGFPLDSVKTRLQTYKYNGNWHCIVDTYKNEGLLGFFRGLTAPLISSSLMRSWSMSIFAYSKPHTHAFWSNFYDTVPLASDMSSGKVANELKASQHTMEYVIRGFPVSWSSGALAGITCSALSCPFEITKLGSQIEIVMKRRELLLKQVLDSSKGISPSIAPAPEVEPLGTYQIAKQLVSHSGFKSLYAGYRYQFFRDAIGSGIYFGVYDSIKSGVSLYLFDTPQAHPISIAIAGGLSGAASWIFVYPLDTCKSQYQRDYLAYVLSGKPNAPKPTNPGIKIKDLFKLKMYRGLGISLIRTSILGTTMFSCYEKLMEVTA